MAEKTLRAYKTSLDPATGLYDGQTMRLRIVEELSRARRYHYPISFVVVTFSCTEAGPAEECVRQLAELLERHVRVVDVLARCRHNCLVMLLPHTDEEGASQLGERVHRLATVMQLPAGLGGQPTPVQVGVATVPEGYSGDVASIPDQLCEKLCRAAGPKQARYTLIPLP
jgi:PleD family two-component response regulator